MLCLQYPDFLVGGLGPKRVGPESGSFGSRRRVGSTTCDSFIGRECSESRVNLLSSRVTSSFHNDVPKYRGLPSSIKASFGMPDKTLFKKKKSKNFQIHAVHRQILPSP